MQKLLQFNKFPNIKNNLSKLENPPEKLFYIGNTGLLEKFKIAVVGTRNPNQYTKNITASLVKSLSKYAVIISGGAIGVDSIAHINSFPNTIMISPSSLDIIYPKENKKMIQNITNEALIISEYENKYHPKRHSFLERNRIVIAISDMVILPQGDLNSGTSSSARYAINLNKPIFTIPQRYNESKLTNSLLAQNKAKAIYNIDDFMREHFKDSINKIQNNSDEILDFCKDSPSFEVALEKFGNKILEYEFRGLLIREANIIRTKC
ncbi:DNA-processing protein DprA [Helicobacter sp. MIT 14-3879]|uniref:DNA-processing protein DprA n=1 Tax=Helicobacter sp. MIT 14-3879 TaxID=2040649 RepID=UPI000E1ED310|nr:DNA-processing protein DprA [Helicobacter sp. MIT 14-3879]RDU64641.1 DNA processing protein DprA [Helicobacter sp. MIT 14-3879]